MKTGFIGAGKMAEAIVASLLTGRRVAAHEIFVSDISAKRRNLLKKQYGVNVYSRNDAVVAEARVLFLAVKPQDLDMVLASIAPGVTDKHLVISIAAGKRLDKIEALVPNARVVRVMPNLASLVSEGMSVYCTGRGVTKADGKTVAELLSAFGKVLEMNETLFDAVTALSGSGPAFFCYFLDKMIDAAVAEGLDRKQATVLAEQTMLGTSRLLIEKSIAPGDLIRAVASPNGTTAAGLAVLDGSDVAGVVASTIGAAARRSKELSL
jgi:pyrroline-5-carboxylate reductase